ncbi:hypothetical protein HUO09_17045 [Vibrio sp. Y2-5]|uniref:type 4 pilus major pilin n=1 Tax=Vibrio sp. Y2-5 TaxID=2743977 RepID=UPI0016601D8F|nr:type 4 pilus major pilin [Vibrio sp. Y2-5]MBD0788063.1 hypothetical protein [Vibrio sp. Y2-5]
MEQSKNVNKFTAPKILTKKRSDGLALLDLIYWGAGILAIVAIIAALYPKAMHQLHMYQLGTDIADIQKASVNWKGRRTNYSNISISDLCKARYLSHSICGASDDATSANPWGGNYTVSVNSDKSLIDVTITGIDDDYGQQVIDSLASRTADECSSAGSNGADCDTISLSGTTATLTLK